MANSRKISDCWVGISLLIPIKFSVLNSKFLMLLCTCALLLLSTAAPAQAKYGGGTGEPNDPYLIYTAEQMNAIGADSNDWDKCFKLMADIDLSGYIGPSPWSPPAPPPLPPPLPLTPPPPPPQPLLVEVVSSTDKEITFNIIGREQFPFTGVFDGNGHTISNFTSRSSDTDTIGLFGYIDGPNAEISNLGLTDPNVDAGTGRFVGSLVGYLVKGTIRGCFIEGGSVSGHDSVGGLVGIVGDRWVYIIDAVTITNCFSSGNVTGNSYVGGLLGRNYYGTITNCYSKSDVSGDYDVGGLVGFNSILSTITNCSSAGSIVGVYGVGGLMGRNGGTISNCDSSSDVRGYYPVGGLTGSNDEGTITNCCAIGSVTGDMCVGGLVGVDYGGAISRCYSTGGIEGRWQVGGLIGFNQGDINICYSSSSVIGHEEVGGLVGSGSGTISNCYSIGSVWGSEGIGGLTGKNWYGTITNCYSAGRVTGSIDVGGLVGYILDCEVTNSFWDIETSRQTGSDGGTGKTTAEMQIMSTFTDAGWDFNAPVWIIDEGVDYPRLWWELVPVLHAEPEVTLGTSNTISWEPVVGAHNEYYAECAEDANCTSVIYNSGWITETNYEFTGLQLDQRYWYCVKARNAAGVESRWSNVESSLQCTLADAVDIVLAPESLKNENLKDALSNKINVVLEMIDEGLYDNALKKLENDILQKMNGCGETGQPDKNDWIITCEEQNEIYPLVIETIEHIRSLMQ